MPASNPINAPWAKAFYNQKFNKKPFNVQQIPTPNNPSPSPSHPSPSPSPLPNPSNPSPPPPPINSNQNSILPALVEVWKSIANRIAGDDHALYIKILNSYFIENGYPGFKTPQFVVNVINNNSPTIPSSHNPLPTKPIPQPPHPLDPNPTPPPPEPLSLNDVGNDGTENDVDTISTKENENESSNENSDIENDSSHYPSDVDNESETETESQGQINLTKYSPMTLRSHPKIKNRNINQVSSRSQSRDQSPELVPFPPHQNINHYNSTNSLYHESCNMLKNRHDEKVKMKPELAQAFVTIKQQIIDFKSNEREQKQKKKKHK